MRDSEGYGSMRLRDYQKIAVDSVWRHLRTRADNPCVVIPTGGGKTPILAELCRTAVKDWEGRVTILAHVKELLEQSYNHLLAADQTLPVGIYSAGLGAKDAGYAITVAGIQSAVNNPDAFGHQDLVVIDEAHRIPPEGDGQYRTFISALKARNPALRLIGLTATPYRMSSGFICKADNLLNKICFEVSISELIHKGYLCPVTASGATQETDFSNVAVRGGEFVASELETLMNDDVKVYMAVSDLVQRTTSRKSILVFASGVKHAGHVAQMIRESTGDMVGEVYGSTDSDERARWISEFRAGKIRWLVNVDVLTLGFDAPNVDCVALMRATKSPGLYYQMCGRGFRLHEGKTSCEVVDFGGNVLRHGLVDAIKPSEGRTAGEGEAPVKRCPQCSVYAPAAASVCPQCGYAYPPPESRGVTHGAKSYNGKILSDGQNGERTTLKVDHVEYAIHTKERDDGSFSTTLRVNYYYEGMDYYPVSEFICIEHGGFAGQKAREWWMMRSNETPPSTVDEAHDRATNGELNTPTEIEVRREGKYARVVRCIFGDRERESEREADHGPASQGAAAQS